MKSLLLISLGIILTAIVSLAAVVGDGSMYRVSKGAVEKIEIHGTCRQIVNHTDSDLMVPVGTELEWRSTYNSPSIFLSSHCCNNAKTCL